ARLETRAFHQELGILTEAWSPIGRGGPVLSDPVVVSIAERLERSPAQIILRWHVQQEIVPVPRSSKPVQLRQNVDVFDFELAPSDMAALAGLDLGESAARDSDSQENGH
ncbi:aldo/keto reductase, partial [Mesorhizobium japonicum]|uniref:aldo/keto reductase n=1 Tax=Mesorhizobium japonicum TaxID=2066070 RepID=UPI003B59DD8D